MLMGVTNLIHTYLWETPNKTEMTTSVQRAGRIGPYPKVNNQYDWLSNTLFKIWLDYRAQRFYLLYRNHLYHYHSTFQYITHMLCADHVILTEHQVTNLVSNFECLFWFFFSRYQNQIRKKYNSLKIIPFELKYRYNTLKVTQISKLGRSQ